uniref:Odorant-binding protein 9 n=1 Tax=Holotrichia oblita TaxID=644536 RepID=A0A3Q8SSR2_HOLOL
MKISLFCFALCVAIVNASIEKYIDQLTTEIATAKTECAKQVGASVDDVVEVSQGKTPTSKEGKCIISCVLKLFGGQDSNGKINKHAVIGKIEELKPIDTDVYEKFSSVWKSCSEKTSDDNDGCDSAAKLMICLAQEVDKHGISKKLIGL